MAPQRLGQHFLSDPNWQQRILAALPKNPGETWLEIGPGHGELTQHLARLASRVVVVEADQNFAKALRERTQTNPREWGNVEVVSGDILETDLEQIAQKLGDGKFHVYGSLPYYITSPILMHLFKSADRIASIHIVIQLEVAERIAAQPGVRDYGYLSVACQFYAQPEILFRIPAGAFKPPPRVTSALLRLSLPGERANLAIHDEKRFLEFVGICFSQKRKTLRNNLRSLAEDDAISEVFTAGSLRRDARAEQLTLTQFAELFAKLSGRFLPQAGDKRIEELQ
jgi:16S rRNA (adenine1518-N6/adenine1519-N6)-dimethyltransferase